MNTKILFSLLSVFVIFSCSNDDDSDDLICFSPDSNLETAYDANVVGCSCEVDIDEDVCIADKDGRLIGLVCENGKWLAVEDGPCIEVLGIDSVNIRLVNLSTESFVNATFNGVNYGDIIAGGKTSYKIFEDSYAYGSVEITINGEKYSWFPVDYVGETPLENGYYTFEYSFDTVTKVLTDELIQESTD